MSKLMPRPSKAPHALHMSSAPWSTDRAAVTTTTTVTTTVTVTVTVAVAVAVVGVRQRRRDLGG